MNRLVIALASLCAVVSFEITLAQPQGGGPPPARVRFDAVRMEPVQTIRTVTGDLRAVKRSRVAAEEAGRVIVFNVDVGDTLEEGQVIARLDPTLMRLEIDRLVADRDAMAAAVDEWDADVQRNQLDLERLREAETRGSLFDTEIENAQAALLGAQARRAKAKADLAAAEAALATAREQLDNLTITAPFTGQVIDKNSEVGEWLPEGGPVVELVSLERLDAILNVPERFIGPISSSEASVEIVVPSVDRQATSSDIVVIASGDELARTFPVRVRLSNDDGLLKPGMSVKGLIPTGRVERALTVHKDAVLRDDAGTYAYFNANGQAMPIRFERLYAVGDRVVVRGELGPGMQLVVEGNERLFPTQPLIDLDNPQPPGGPQAGPNGRGEGRGGGPPQESKQESTQAASDTSN